MQNTTKNKLIVLRRFVDGFNDQQHLRIITGNRLVAQFRDRLGINNPEKEEDAEKAISIIKEQYHRYTDGAVNALNEGVVDTGVGKLKRKIVLEGGGIFSDVNELYLVESYMQMVKTEALLHRRLQKLLTGIPIYDTFMDPIPGVGTISSAYLLSYLDPHKAKYASSFWKYCGLDVASDGRGRGRYKEHLVKHVAKRQDGGETEFMGLSFQPLLKSKLYLLAQCFVKVKGSKYNDAYYDYKNRLVNRADTRQCLADCSGTVAITPGETEGFTSVIVNGNKQDYGYTAYPGAKLQVKDGEVVKKGQLLFGLTAAHTNNRALRYIVKLFLADLHTAWRTLEGLPVAAPYHEAKLGLHHGVDV